MSEFWDEMSKADRCIRLTEQLLNEERKILNHLRERGYNTSTSEYRIARMEYALGQKKLHPDYRDYFTNARKD